MIVKNNYSECITNLACSIRKYFKLDYKHNTLSYIDKLLEEKQPKNVVVMLFDGMGSRILDRTLEKDDFFIKNKFKEITTVFPATTTAATYSVMTGLNPVEHGFLGWYSYIKPLDEVIMLFKGINKDTQNVDERFFEVKEKYFVNKTITDEINENGKYKSRILFPFGENKYNDLDDMLSIIKNECDLDGKKYIYAYNDEPDHLMHMVGPDNIDVKNLMHHELMHYIDIYMRQKNPTLNLEEIMRSYNPEGFSYGSNDKSYDYNFSNPNDAYFLSYYSRQSYLEDRAVLFSDMMTRSTKRDYYNDGTPINKKAKLISFQIKEHFNTLSNTGRYYWDRFL